MFFNSVTYRRLKQWIVWIKLLVDNLNLNVIYLTCNFLLKFRNFLFGYPSKFNYATLLLSKLWPMFIFPVSNEAQCRLQFSSLDFFFKLKSKFVLLLAYLEFVFHYFKAPRKSTYICMGVNIILHFHVHFPKPISVYLSHIWDNILCNLSPKLWWGQSFKSWVSKGELQEIWHPQCCWRLVRAVPQKVATSPSRDTGVFTNAIKHDHKEEKIIKQS